MKAHFIKMINYDQYGNLLMLKSILEINAPEKPVQLMAHLLAAQQIWLNRCKSLSATGFALWPDWKAETFEQIIVENHQSWIDFIKQLNTDDFSRMINYQNSKGENFQNQLSDVLAHLINHGTHHRAQIGQHLKMAGLNQLPATDYIFYIRNEGL
jgi:uncharacterized damage-inducible protein DinB